MARFVVSLPERDAAPDDYEAALAPLYAWMHALTQRAGHARISGSAGASARTWVALTSRERHRHPLRMATLGTGYVAAVAALNALGLGPLDRDLSPAALRRGYLRGIREVVRRLGIRAEHVIWGHSHRAGPFDQDDAQEWRGIVNCGSWVYQPHFVGAAGDGSPYWPGTAVLVEDSGPPKLLRLLDGVRLP
jgi:hypothetical protein